MWTRRLPAAIVARALVSIVALVLVSAAASATAGGAKHPAALSNRQLAVRDARGLLKLLVLPPTATAAASEPAGDGGVLAHPALAPGATSVLVDRHGWWRAPESPAALLAFVQAHAPRGSRQTGSGQTGGGQQRPSAFVVFTWPPEAGKLGARALVVEVVALADGTSGLRADAQVVWILKRSRAERIPAGARELGVSVARAMQPPSSAFTVTDGAKIRRVESLIDRLPIVQPAAIACPEEPADPAVVTFAFRAHAGSAVPLAQASERDDMSAPASPCNGMIFMVRGRVQTPLLAGGRTLAEIGRILGATFA